MFFLHNSVFWDKNFSKSKWVKAGSATAYVLKKTAKKLPKRLYLVQTSSMIGYKIIMPCNLLMRFDRDEVK